MKSNIEYLSRSITPTCSGIIWLTDEHLNQSISGLYEFNYLLDGLLTKSLLDQIEREEKQNNNFFFSSNFGKPFFIGHSVIKGSQDLKQIHENLKLALPLIPEDSEIFILNKSKNTANINIEKELTQKYKNIKFEHLNI